MTINRQINKILKYFLLILFLGYYGSITFFVHVHVVNGVTIVHSHPYNIFKGKKGDKSPPHHHSANSYIVIHVLSHFISTALSVAIFAEVLKLVFKILILKKENNLFSNPIFWGANGFRGPPVNINTNIL